MPTRSPHRSVELASTLAIGLFLGSCGESYRVQTLAYDPRFGSQTQLDLYEPSGDARPRPAVLLVHGGAWDSESKSDLSPEASRLAQHGYVVANINYRLAPVWHYPVLLQDVWCALAWLRGQASEHGIDPTAIAVLGYSAGGYLVEMVGLSPTFPGQALDYPSGPTGPPAAVVAGDAPADLLGIAAEPTGASTVEELMGCDGGSCAPAADPQLYTQASPVANVASGAPPFFLVHGTGDCDWMSR